MEGSVAHCAFPFFPHLTFDFYAIFEFLEVFYFSYIKLYVHIKQWETFINSNRI